ncbi:hypothetical protein [Micromonospora sp. WMMD812]|uniref:hypothetical protein n=1 Tax=Micromonospora sp. WMMD812 TaxID=3015152 RepID=UPI00248B0A46|nr:hypothetical protein [Micromonospora sp. WMMD812]WBB65871.1 hypothetical protein O7603_22125 [Micromonospora sp. WMMD812]
MTHQVFDELIGTPPPSRVDVDGIVRRERRSRSARRLGGALAAVLALALAVGVRDRPGAAEVTPRASASSPTADTRFRLVFDTDETADATARRLGQELDRAMRKVAPGAVWFWMPDQPGEPRRPDGQAPTFSHRGRADLINGSSGLSYQGRRGALRLSISPEVHSDASSGPVSYYWACRMPPDVREDNRYHRVCEEATSPGGARMKIQTYTGKRQPTVQHLVVVQLPDNRTLELSVQNMVGVDESAVPAQPEAPLSREQVREIAVQIADQIKS